MNVEVWQWTPAAHPHPASVCCVSIPFTIQTLQNVTSSSTCATDQNILQGLFYTTTIKVRPDEGPVRSETCSSSMFLKYYCKLNDEHLHLLVKIVKKRMSRTINTLESHLLVGSEEAGMCTRQCMPLAGSVSHTVLLPTSFPIHIYNLLDLYSILLHFIMAV